MRYYPRQLYLNRLRPFYHSDLIKVVTGIRRCGKSCLLRTVMDELRADGIPETNLIDINLDLRKYRQVTHASDLESLLDERLRRVVSGSMAYVFIDEIQNVRDFEPVVNGFREEGGISIFLTGSNSYLLSGELATKLTGRHLVFDMFPLTFDEFLQMKEFLGVRKLSSLDAEFREFLRGGGFPQSLEFQNIDEKLVYAANLVEQIFAKDIFARRKVRDRDLFDRISTYIVNNFGASTSISGILDGMRRLGISTRRETVSRYLELLENAKLINKCPRFDLKSKKSIGAQEKYYLSDLSIYFARNVDQRIHYGPVLENMLYIYLRSRGYSLSVGKVGSLECDFVARRNDEHAYIQVAMTIADSATEEREYRVFRNIRNGYPRFLFTLDPLLQEREGVIHLNLMDFMANGKDLSAYAVRTAH